MSQDNHKSRGHWAYSHLEGAPLEELLKEMQEYNIHWEGKSLKEVILAIRAEYMAVRKRLRGPGAQWGDQLSRCKFHFFEYELLKLSKWPYHDDVVGVSLLKEIFNMQKE